MPELKSELIFEMSRPGCVAYSQHIPCSGEHELPPSLLRQTSTMIPEVSELDVVRHYTLLSQKNFSIDTHPYYLGSCTMKYNPRAAHRAAMFSGFANAHPMAPSSVSSASSRRSSLALNPRPRSPLPPSLIKKSFFPA